MQLKDGWFEMAGSPIYARVPEAKDSTRPRVVLVHGLGVSGTYMLPTAELLATDFAVYVPDLPGWGKSYKPPRALSIPELADALASWVGTAGLPSATFVANSLGCQVVIELAIRYPALVEHAVLVGPTIDMQARSLLRQAGRGAIDLLREPLSLLPILIRDYLTMGPLRVARTLQYAIDDPVVQKLANVQVPTLVIRGGRDPIASQAWVERLTRLLPAGKLLVIPRACHAANFMAPLPVARAVRCFIGSSKGINVLSDEIIPDGQ